MQGGSEDGKASESRAREESHVESARERYLREELARTEERFNEAESVAGVGHWEFDAISGKVMWSKELLRLFGLGAEKGAGALGFEEHLQGNVHPDDRSRYRAVVESAIAAGESWEIEYRALVRGGAPRWILAKGRADRGADGALLGIRGTAQDVHLKKIAEFALAEANRKLGELAHRAEQASVAKSQFLAMMSHEIRTPLNGVLGMASLLETTELDPEQKQYVEVIRTSGDALLAILNDVLDLSKVEAGHLEFRNEEFDLVEVTRAVAMLFRAAAEQKGVSVVARENVRGSSRVRGDAHRLRQILVNLVGNAVKFTDHGHIQVHLTTRELEDEEVFVHIAVSDTGPGIPADAREKIFEPFTQVDGGATRRHGGTGLGLALSRRLAEKMGALLGVTSELGEGSTFSLEICLPLAVETKKPERVVEQERGRKSPRVLVAEDNPVNRLVAEKLLIALGCEVLLVEDGEAAVEELSRSTVDLVFMDCHMPGLDGYEATRRLRESGLDKLPIVALTANAFREDQERCFEAGMNDHLAKPVSRESLGQMLVKWLPN